MRDMHGIILRPVVTEKSAVMGETRGQYAFIVAKDANKIEIRRAVEQLFNVRVQTVRTMNYRGKERRVGRQIGRRAAFKKAVVQLAEGDRIDIYEGTEGV